ncbi:MAG TPA: NADH-ubiquinone oxidoreductase-F iron-sulfur binding region domain-containing protein [Acidimicrobiales bacterium]|nr:NADH-ubiquinone oxidoreductase-F iron-sulfur binding region domain-containing protein [Acidimicrobiales bacterium]
MTTSVVVDRLDERRPGPGDTFGGVGHPGARLLAGRPAYDGTETLAQHLDRLGIVPPPRRGAGLVDAVHDSGLGGRGGAGFPMAEKMEAAARAPGPRLVVVNASESEPASHKDRVLVHLRPHLVLDGAALAAEALSADEIVVQLHRGDPAGYGALSAAIAERTAARLDRVPVHLSVGPDRFVAGESSAVVAFLEGRPAQPRPGPRAAVSGVHGCPTLVQNAETLAHVALIARFGPDWFRAAGTPGSPGSVLVTLAGDVERPGTVLEVWGATTIGRLLVSCSRSGHATIAEIGPVPGAAVLMGGYAGAWADMARVWELPLAHDELCRAGVPLGCGLVGVLSPDGCGLVETARLLTYLATESSGQCGPCAFGLPDLAAQATALATTRVSRSAVRRLYHRTASIAGRGACSHPDGAVRLLESALETFAGDVRYHLRHGPCAGARNGVTFPVPRSSEEWR